MRNVPGAVSKGYVAPPGGQSPVRILNRTPKISQAVQKSLRERQRAVMETRKAEHLRECAEWEAQIAQEEAMHKVPAPGRPRVPSSQPQQVEATLHRVQEEERTQRDRLVAQQEEFRARVLARQRESQGWLARSGPVLQEASRFSQLVSALGSQRGGQPMERYDSHQSWETRGWQGSSPASSVRPGREERSHRTYEQPRENRAQRDPPRASPAGQGGTSWSGHPAAETDDW
uniref:Uncharacterized protein n=1 Tax=Auxenochlorella protothecoides TaxID=3075 RepID=A0A1D2A596_AUXPR